MSYHHYADEAAAAAAARSVWYQELAEQFELAEWRER